MHSLGGAIHESCPTLFLPDVRRRLPCSGTTGRVLRFFGGPTDSELLSAYLPAKELQEALEAPRSCAESVPATKWLYTLKGEGEGS